MSTSKRPSLSLHLDTHLTEELLTDYCFVWKLTRYSLFQHRQIRQSIVNTLLMSRINPTCNRLFIFICQEKKQKPGLHLQWAGNKLLIMFFHRCSYEISCLVSWHNALACANLRIWTASEALALWYIYNNRHSLKQPQSHFHSGIPHKSHHFLLFSFIFFMAGKI